jgi:two-component system KDP operon response regulator KdpE
MDDVSMDLEKHVVTKGGEEVKLTPIEFNLFATMVRQPGRVLTHQHLLREVWGLHSTTQKQYLHVYVGHLRSKLETEPARPKFIITEPGIGYRLRLPK